MIKTLEALTGVAALFAAAIFVWATFNPQVDAVVRGLVKYTGRPLVYVATPEVRDWSSVRIKLTRTMCFGYCPAYSVEIAGDGSVEYHGEHFVAVEGVQRATISAQRVRDLISKFREAGFFWLYDSYETPITDNPTYIVTLSYDGRTKTVLDYVGRESGMPAVVTDLENAVDETAGTLRWVGQASPPR